MIETPCELCSYESPCDACQDLHAQLGHERDAALARVQELEADKRALMGVISETRAALDERDHALARAEELEAVLCGVFTKLRDYQDRYPAPLYWSDLSAVLVTITAVIGERGEKDHD